MPQLAGEGPAVAESAGVLRPPACEWKAELDPFQGESKTQGKQLAFEKKNGWKE